MTALNFPAESNAVRFEINATPVSIPKSIGKSAAIFTQKKILELTRSFSMAFDEKFLYKCGD